MVWAGLNEPVRGDLERIAGLDRLRAKRPAFFDAGGCIHAKNQANHPASFIECATCIRRNISQRNLRLGSRFYALDWVYTVDHLGISMDGQRSDF